MSGMSNVEHWLAGHGYEPERELVARILRAAKEGTGPLTDAEIENMVHSTDA